MNKEKKYKVYALVDPRDGMVRYIGLTRRDIKKRLIGHLTKEDRNPKKWNWVKKLKREDLKPEIKVLFKNLTEEEACQKEIELIAEYRDILGDKILNIHDGGNIPPVQYGDKNFYRTERGRALSSLRNSGSGHPNYGKFGGDSFNSKAVDQYDLRGNFINSWDSIIEAERYLKLEKKSHISDCCNKKIKKSCGYIWRWKGDRLGNVNLRSKRFRKIKCIETGKIYNTIKEASKKHGIDPSSLTSVCRGSRKSAGGYTWEYIDNKGVLKAAKGRCVDKYSVDDKFINRFDNIQEAARSAGVSDSSIRSCCSGQRKKSGGFVWKWV